ncbi:hypothetical protein MPSI1_002443 [Malassezia psittaci]|uniref:6-phosphogluconate dehydrogenase, decarboxylating n=1 Tax=Malassezia psittaci TaxID=1821823 RepID=A0AAF0FBA3_9BASI|nr:hypothetical protein MPSI1_002443 [Malassezia psittaci]
MTDQGTQSLAFAIADWLQSKQVASIDATKREQAAKLISEAFDVDTSSATDRATYAKGSPGLKAIFDVFLKAQKKMAPSDEAGQTNSEKKGSDVSTASVTISEEDRSKAEDLKNQGNKAMTAKDYGAALKSYTQAIEINGNSPVYYSNRAAAYSQIGQHDEAIADAKKAAELDPKFGKAYSRLGHALFASGQYEEALAAYEKGYEVDPSNKLMKSGIDASKAKLAQSSKDGAMTSAATDDLSAGADASAGAGANMGGGGMPDLGSLLNNPMLSSMASQMMQNGGLEQLMNNPMLRQMADQFGGGGGQMPDLNAMMNNPQLRHADIGLIGLAVMGQNLILNMNDKGYTVAAYNRTTSKVDSFLENEAKGTKVVGAHSIQEFVSLLKRPRKIILLVKAGPAVDAFIQQLEPYLEKGDIIIDGGNSHFPDSDRRTKELESKGLLFVGSGVSGGEEGARHGPSLMPGGSADAWPAIKEIFQKTAAQSDGEPCCDWVGDGGAGHYVKMVHNGIEYGDMQLIAEAYAILKIGLGMDEQEISDIFAEWNKGVLDSFLIEITRDILAYKDTDGKPMLPKILDSAGQKGTGKWTAINALDLGQPVTLVTEAVFARCLSSLKAERERASKILSGPKIKPFEGDKQQFIKDLEQSLYASKIVSYAQGFMLMREAAKEYNWRLNNPSIALMWRGGCIIRSVFLKDITSAFRKNPELENLLFDDFFKEAIQKADEGWRRVVAQAVLWGIPTPATSSALAFYDGVRSAVLPANLLQAQRDYFGAHTFRVLPGQESDRLPDGQDIHVNWTGRGGNVSASTYSA